MEQALYWLVGAIGVPLITKLKERFGLEGKQALTLSLVCSLVLGVVALFASSALGLQDFTGVGIFTSLGQVFAAATLAYKLLNE